MAMSDWLDREHGHAFPADNGHDVIYCGRCGLESCFWSRCPCIDEQAALRKALRDGTAERGKGVIYADEVHFDL